MLVDLTVPCDVWTGHCNTRSGHGQRWDSAAKKVRGAHVMAWEEANGMPVPPGQLVRHACDNPPCREARHLELGTHKDNRDDMMARHPERYSPPPVRWRDEHPRAKLSSDQVAAIRAAYTGKRGEKAALAREFGVSATWIAVLLREGAHHAAFAN